MNPFGFADWSAGPTGLTAGVLRVNGVKRWPEGAWKAWASAGRGASIGCPADSTYVLWRRSPAGDEMDLKNQGLSGRIDVGRMSR